ncbi:MAG TPA: glycosyltransferase family 4 protein [Phycisphaerae bacterium]|nr:glycosyltransferase family 4 protein [Phycisphaerae bacterium]
MKIAMIIERMDTARGGRETSTAQIAEALARRGHEVTVLCQRGSWRGEGVQVRPLGRRGLLRVGRLRSFIADVRDAIAAERFDIVHSMIPVPGANVYQPRGGVIPAQVAGSRRLWGAAGRIRVAIFEPMNLCRNLLAQLEREVVADSRVLCLAVSEMVARDFREHYGRTENVRVVYNGVAVPDVAAEQRAEWRREQRKELRVKEGDTVFLMVATNFRLKGGPETIRAFTRWYASRRSRPNARLVILGHGFPAIHHRSADLRDVALKIRMLPWTDDVFRWYSAADACVLLTWYDPCSRVVLEATRWGVPSITTVFNGAAEVLAAGGGIVVSSPRDTDAVVRAMDELADPARRAERSIACLCAADHLDVERHVDELLLAYQSLSARPAGLKDRV